MLNAFFLVPKSMMGKRLLILGAGPFQELPDNVEHQYVNGCRRYPLILCEFCIKPQIGSR